MLHLFYKALDDKAEPVKIAGIQGIEYILDNLGCGVCNNLSQILI